MTTAKAILLACGAVMFLWGLHTPGMGAPLAACVIGGMLMGLAFN